MRRGLFITLVALVVFAAQIAAARPPTRAERERYRGPGAREIPRRSRSVGYPWHGHLRNGVRIHENAYLRVAGEYEDSQNMYGTWELVQLIERAAYRVVRREGEGRLTIGELSARNGGDVQGHGSHENGRDADIGFYMRDRDGDPHAPYAFARFGADGVGLPPNQAYTFDDGRNWELVAKLVADGDARVQYVFVANHLKTRLLREGRRRHAPQSVLDRAAQVMVQPASHPHDNHFHVRIYCPPADRPACEDRGPYHAWYPGTPPVLARR